MTPIIAIAKRLTSELDRGINRLLKAQPGVRHEQGDVPGWVMITLMTAALVVLIWAVAGPALTDLFNNAIQRVTNL